MKRVQYRKSATWEEYNTKKVQREKVQHEIGHYEENMKSERNSETRKECNTKKVQHGKSET